MNWSSLKPADKRAIKRDYPWSAKALSGCDWRQDSIGRWVCRHMTPVKPARPWENAPTDYAESVIKHAYRKQRAVRPAPKRPIAQPIKARKMWAPGFGKNGGMVLPEASLHPDNRRDPVFVIPATKEAYEQLVETMAWGIAADDLHRPPGEKPWTDCYGSNESYYDAARAALSSIGITEPKT